MEDEAARREHRRPYRERVFLKLAELPSPLGARLIILSVSEPKAPAAASKAAARLLNDFKFAVLMRRFPIRIHLDYQPSPDQQQRLRAGASVTATVDTTNLDTAND